jgi:hypothetical protein
MQSSHIAEKDLNIDIVKAEDEMSKITARTAPAAGADVEFVAAPVLNPKRSIFFMVLFSGLAIGSDAYNSAAMGQLLLLFGVLYPDTLSVATQSQLTNAFIIGLVR